VSLTAAKVVSANSVGLLVPVLVNSPARSTLFVAVRQVKVLTSDHVTVPAPAAFMPVAWAATRTSPPDVSSPPVSEASVYPPVLAVPSAMYANVPAPAPLAMRLLIQFCPAFMMWLRVLIW